MGARPGLPARSSVTPKVLQNAVWARSNNDSYLAAEETMRQLAGVDISAKRIRAMTNTAGDERLAERREAVEQLRQMPLPKRQAGSAASEPPPLAVTSMDGGRYQHRDRFGETYYCNNHSRMDYRREGLPLTRSHIESTVKLINCRIKGSEKFWERSSGEAVLQLRADSLSDSRPLEGFWRRWQAQQTGSNRYRAAA